MAKLTGKQEKFVAAYLRLHNASAAYREAYDAKNMSDKTINEAASRLMAHSKVSARIGAVVQKAAAKLEMDVEGTLRELCRISQSDVRKLFNADGTMIPIHELDDDTAAALSSIEVDEIKAGAVVIGHTKKVKFWDKNSALEKAMKHLGLFEKDNKQQAPVAVSIELVG